MRMLSRLKIWIRNADLLWVITRQYAGYDSSMCNAKAIAKTAYCHGSDAGFLCVSGYCLHLIVASSSEVFPVSHLLLLSQFNLSHTSCPFIHKESWLVVESPWELRLIENIYYWWSEKFPRWNLRVINNHKWDKRGKLPWCAKTTWSPPSGWLQCSSSCPLTVSKWDIAQAKNV